MAKLQSNLRMSQFCCIVLLIVVQTVFIQAGPTSKISPGLLKSMERKQKLDIIFGTDGKDSLAKVVNYIQEENKKGQGFQYETYEIISGGHVSNATPVLIRYLNDQPGVKYIEENAVSCTQQYDPVCAENGKTYSNDCERERAQSDNPQEKIGKVHSGEC